MNCEINGRRLGRLILAIILNPALTPALAQSTLPSRLVAPSYQPGSFSISKPLDVGQFSGASVPKGAEKLEFKAGKVVIEDDPGLLPAARDALVAAIAGKSMSVADVFAAARAFESAYADAGYVLTRVVIPPQKIVNGGTVRLTIINGFLETADVSAVPERVREPVRTRIAPLLGRPGVTRSEIERAVLLAGDVAGVSLRSTLSAGPTPGSTKIVLDGTHDLMTGSFSIDNRADKQLGPWLFNANAAINSGLGHGEQIYFAWSGAPHDPVTAHAPVRTAALGVLIPVGVDGLAFSPEAAWSRSIPEVSAGAPGSDNNFMRLALRSQYALVRSVDFNLALRGGVERVEQKVQYPALAGADRLDRYTVARASLEAQENYVYGSLTQALSISQGLGGRDQADALSSGVSLSRQFTSPDFTKIGFALQARAASENVAVSVTFRSQYSFNHALFASEQLALDGSDALSGYTSGALPVDQGAVLRGELSPAQALIIAPRVSVTPYLFSAYGMGALRHATIVEAPFQRVTSYGLGTRASIGDFVPGLSGAIWQLEYARSIANPTTTAKGDRITAAVTVRF